MALSAAAQQLRDQYFQSLLRSVSPLQKDADIEVSLEALIEAIAMLKDRFEQELAELRQETTD